MSSGPDEALAAHELDLVSRAAKGDAAAFDRFFERNAPSVQLLVERLLGPGEAADAVVLEAFEKTVRRLPLLGARNSSPALYVLSTARNGAYAALGRGRPTADGGPLAALLALPSRQRELLALRELGLSEAHCAEVAGIDASDVGAQVARARLRLTDELEGLTLSSVFADDRAERLLAAEVVRVEGQPVPASLAQEISSHADENSRFAAALSAVRSPSRSVGQLPALSGPARLAAPARAQAVAGSAPAGAPAPGVVAAAAAASAAGQAVPADPGVMAGPRAVPRSTGDPYDDDIGDEIAWGIVDDDDEGAFESSAAGGADPALDSPSDGQWEDGAGAISDEPPTQIVPRGPARPLAGAGGPAGPNSADPSLADPFAGWDDALDWDEDEKEWAAGPGGAAAAAGAAGAADAQATPHLVKDGGEGYPDMAPRGLRGPIEENTIAAAASGSLIPAHQSDLGETRAFDAVAAGLVDPDPIPVSDFDHGDEQVGGGGRSKWRWVIWLVALLLLFVGCVVAAYAYQSANQDPDLPPTSRLDDTTPARKSSATPKASTPKKKAAASSSTKGTPKPTSGTSPSSASDESGSSSAGSTAGSGTGAAGSGGTSTGSKPSSSGTKPATESGSQVVSPGESTSGGAVRGPGEEAASGTTP